MDDNERLKQLYARLREIDSNNEVDSFPQSNEPTKAGALSVEDENRLAYLKSELARIDNNEPKKSQLLPGYDFSEVRGAAKTYGGIADLVEGTGYKDYGRHIAEKTMTPEQLEAWKQEHPEKIGPSHHKEDYVKFVDELAGRDTTPTSTTGKFREKLGEFLAIPFPGVGNTLKVAPAVAAGSTALRELGLDESYADLIAAIGVPNIKALSKLPGNVIRKLGDYLGHLNKDYRQAGNVEKAAEFLQKKVGEANISEVVKNIEGYEIPFKGDIAKGEAAYRPLTADIADNVGLSQYHRAKAENIPAIGEKRQTNAEVLQREIDNLASKNATAQASQEFAAAEREAYKAGLTAEEMAARQMAEEAGSQFNQTSKIDEAGRETQDYLSNRVGEVKKEAQIQAEPFYEAAKNKELEGQPKTAFNAIEQQLKKYSRTDPANKDARRAKIAIEHAGGESVEKHQKLISEIKKKYKDDPKMMDIALKEAEKVPRGTYTAESLDTAKQTLNRIFNEIPPTESGRRRVFSEIMKNLDKDMESIPEIFKARQVYHEVMKPANFIEEHPVLGKLINQDQGFTKPFTVTHAEIPKRVINGSKSIEGAKALMTEASGLGKTEHKTMIETLKSYINSDILSNFVENTGKVNPTKFKSWSDSNPGAFILYPELKTKLKNLENAQIHVDRVIKQNEELIGNFYKETMNKFLGDKFKGVNPERIAGRILDSDNSVAIMDEAVELLSKDATGNALEGLRRAIVNDLKSKFKSDNFTFATLNSYLTKNKKALSKLFNDDQIKVLENSKDLLKAQAVMERAGKGTNSDSIPKLMENLAEQTGEKASKALFGLGTSSWAVKALGALKNIGQAGKMDYIEKALLDPKMAKFLLQKDIKTKKNFFDSLNNKEDFAKWLRSSESAVDIVKDFGKDAIKNFAITSEYFAKAKLNSKD